MTPDTETGDPGAPFQFGTVGGRRLPQMLVDSITETILREGLEPGTRLPSEREMCEQFGVGRGTLREALRVLEAEGLVTVGPRSEGGRTVSSPNPRRLIRLLVVLLIAWDTTLLDVHRARLAIQPLVARTAAERSDPEAVSKLHHSVELLEGLIDDEGAFIAENQRFHRLLGEATGNPVLVVISAALISVFDGNAMGAHYSAATRRYAIETHAKIVDAIATGNAKKAEAIALLHIEDSISHLEHRFPELLGQAIKPALQPPR
jgi:GntR family transcriptional regulator, transcriptional repressor for pyruvate dehydrogenase complex